MLYLTQIKKCYLFMYYVAQTQVAAHMNVNQRRKPKFLNFSIGSISLVIFFCALQDIFQS